jgi:ferredoxin--NADP+ reductase/benzoate/toluate 1,2-dioxygenase reductase subunit
LTFERPFDRFRAGQYVCVGLPALRERREYSVYSSEGEPHLTILIREVEGGAVSPRLAALRPGDRISVEGPFGRLAAFPGEGPHLFVATGTGISPFHSMAVSYPGLEYVLIHGVRTVDDLSLASGFSSDRVVSCVSRGHGGTFTGRVTDFLRRWEVPPGSRAYLCGNCAMIFESFDLLMAAGLASDRIATEVYF